MNVFVTGASGFIGAALVTELQQRGHEVIALVRRRAQFDQMVALGVRPVWCDLFSIDRLAQAMAGCEVVFHLAGENKWGVRNPYPMLKVNIAGTVSVAQAAKQAGVRRLVYTSSAAAIGEAKGTIGREDSVYRGWHMSEYEASKRSAEAALLEMTGLEIVIVNPSSVQGPGRVAGTGKIMLAIVNGTLPVFVDTRFSICHITDCVQGHILAAERGQPGERYILSGATVTTGEVFGQLAEITGLKLRPRYIPHWLAMGGAIVAQYYAWARGRDPSWSREKMAAILHGHHFDGSKATRELGLQYTPLSRALYETIQWYREHGLIRRPLPRLDP
ncbi:MAG: NAD-dependent epimerase/dehydratase family protein [Candidatus Kerfeldbacteria bacterium]|nr:NAD-dependent epimerase/dehydratase family protein [Candidatus Kerfeldbacteria bacterium]